MWNVVFFLLLLFFSFLFLGRGWGWGGWVRGLGREGRRGEREGMVMWGLFADMG